MTRRWVLSLLLHHRRDRKLELMRLTEKLGGNIELAIRQLADSKRSQVKGIGII